MPQQWCNFLLEVVSFLLEKDYLTTNIALLLVEFRCMHTHQLAELYGATVILHTDHCAKKLLPWIDGLLDASEDFYKVHGKSLYSSHMIDLSEEP